MLGKLIKQEFKNTYKLMLALYGAYAGIAVLAGISAHLLASGKAENIEGLPIAILPIFILSSIAVYVATFIYICVNYYKTMYSLQGYLTHTLPVKTTTIFNVKLLVSFIWLLASIFILFVAVFLVVNLASYGEFFNLLTQFNPADFSRRFFEEFGMKFSTVFTYGVICCFLGLLVMILWIFTSFSIGQLSGKHRVAISVVTAVGIYMANQIFSFILLFINVQRYAPNQTVLNSAEYFKNLMNTEIIWISAAAVIMYTVCMLINKKRINLE